MALFNSDIEAIIYIIIIGITLFIISKTATYLMRHVKKISIKTENKISFILSLIFFVIIVYLVIEGFPSFEQIDPTYAAILTGAISTALAFASSGVFKNLVAGIVLMFVGPFDIGDIVKVEDNKGIIRHITLSKTILETFDGKFIEISNTEVFSSSIVNYTKKLYKVRNFEQFLKKIQTPQVKAMAELKELDETYLRKLFEDCKKIRNPIIHKYTFRMEYPIERFRKKMEETHELCLKYRENFGARPWYDIVNFGAEIHVKFTILTLDSNTILEDQPKFAHDLYKIILQHN
ncbi:MAG: mechanosensitive ion channel domain-containing protein [Candidatus Hodarchaeota archaeon]